MLVKCVVIGLKVVHEYNYMEMQIKMITQSISKGNHNLWGQDLNFYTTLFFNHQLAQVGSMMQVYFLVKFASKLMNNLKKKRLSIIKQIYEVSKYIYIFFSAPCVHVIILDGSITERTSQINVKQLSNIKELATYQLLLLNTQ